MEESKRTRNDQEKKKMFIKVGGGGGGIGAVVILGGVLATAALASSFIVRKKGRGSGEDRCRRHQNPPPEIKKQNDQDEANKGQQQLVSDVYKQPSIEATKEIESDKNLGFLVSTESLIMDDKAGIEINGGKAGDVYDFDPKNEQIHSSISLKKLENSAISDGPVIVKQKDENLLAEPQNMMQNEDGVKIQSTKEDVSDETSKDSKNLEQAYVKEDGEERKPCDDGENEGTKINYKEAVERNSEVTIADNAVEGVHIDQHDAQENGNAEVKKEEKEEKEFEGFCCDNGEIGEKRCEEAIKKTGSSLSEAIASESHFEDGQKTLLPVSDSPVIEHENAKGDEIVSESRAEDGQKTLLPISHSPVIQHENVTVDGIVSESHSEDGQEARLPVFDSPVIEHENVKGDEIVSESWIEDGQKTLLPVSDSPVIQHENVKVDGIVSESHSENGQEARLPVFDSPVIEHENVKGDEIASKSYSEDRQKAHLPEFDGPVVEHENENGDEKEDAKPTEIVEIVEEDEKAIEESGEDEVKYIEEIWVKEEEEKCDQHDEGIVFVPVKCEEVECMGEANQNNPQIDENRQETDNPTPENGGVGVVMLEQDLISLENNEVINKDGANEEVSENMEEVEDSSEIVEEIEDSSETINTGIATTKNDLIMETSDDEEKTESMKDSDDETDSSDEVEESSVGTGDSSFESNSEAVWPAESIHEPATETQHSELKGKIEEDGAVKKANDSNEKYYLTRAETERSFIKHLAGMAILKDHATNLTRRKVIIGTASVLSSLSCSWFFGLSFVKLCLIVCLTMVLSKIHGY